MIVLYILAWVVLVLLALLVLILLVPVRYQLSGCWQEKFSGDLKIGIGPFKGLMKWAADGNNSFSFLLAGITLKKSPLNKKAEKKKEEPSPEKKSPGSNWRDAFGFMEKDFIKAMFRTAGDILHYCSPRIIKLEGVWGFDDPYYTGILAATVAVIPGIQVESDFTREERCLLFP